MIRLEHLLYRTYEILSKPVTASVSSEMPKGTPEDPYAAVSDALKVADAVSRLPDLHIYIIGLVYGRVEQPELFNYVSETLGIPFHAAELLCLHWAGFPDRPEMKTLAPLLGCSKSGISRVYRKVCLLSDNLLSDALHGLYVYLKGRNWYNQIM